VVESAKAGDKVVFSGSVVVLPDSSGLSSTGEGAVAVKAGRRNDSYGDGVQGLKSLGVREMTYKMIFIACSVQHTDQRFSDPMAGPVVDLGGGEVIDYLII
jgi:DNA replication licensing factor MCM6